MVNGGVLSVTNTVVSRNTAGPAENGGGIVNFGSDFSVFGGEISRNRAPRGAGLANYGPATISECEFFENTALSKGGAILGGRSNLTLNRLSVFDNTAGTEGAGIYIDRATITVIHSTIHSNTAELGGGVCNGTGVLTLINSTVSGNMALSGNGGGLAATNPGGESNLIHSSIAKNHADLSGGGVFVSQGTVRAGNTIIANNTAAQSSPDLFGTLTSLDFNLIGDTSNATLSGPIASSILDADPMMGPLADNGGPTLTHNLLAWSPAIDAGSAGLSMSEVLTEDQRAFIRIGDIGSIPNAAGGVDIGAVEIIAIEVDDEIAFENEGEIGFTISVSHAPPAGQPVTVRFDTASVEGGADATEDYTPVSDGLLTFTSAGPFIQNIVVPLVDDSVMEPNEAFEIVLSEAVGATIFDATASGTIIDDDASTETPTPTVTITPTETSSPTPTATRTAMPSGTINYDVQPIPTDGIVNDLDLIEWYRRVVEDGTPESKVLFDFSLHWKR